MAAATAQLTSLPVELLNIIAGHSSTEELFSLNLSSRYLNEVFTPALYSTISPENVASAEACLATLATPPEELFLRRDLAALVCTLSLDIRGYYLPHNAAAELHQHLKRAVSRMCGLQHLRIRLFRQLTPALCISIFRAAAPTLISLDLRLGDDEEWIDASEEQALSDFTPMCPNLSQVALQLYDSTSESFHLFFNRLLSSHAARLRTFSIRTSRTRYASVCAVLPRGAAWPILEDLEIEISLLSDDWWSATPAVRSLVVHGESCMYAPSGDPAEGSWADSPLYYGGKVLVPPGAFTQLEELHCPHGLLPVFLPPLVDIASRRPIKKLVLDQAEFWKGGGWQDPGPTAIPPGWENVRHALDHLAYSGAPVHELALFVGSLNLETFAIDVVPYLKTLEKLLLVVDEVAYNGDALADFGQKVFAHAPTLHTFVLSDGPLNARHRRFHFDLGNRYHEQRVWLTRWHEYAPALRKVALTNAFGWTRTGSVWTPDDPYVSKHLSVVVEQDKVVARTRDDLITFHTS